MPFQAYQGTRSGEPAEFYALVEEKPGLITDVLVRVVQQEGPIHIAEATRRVVSHWGMGKAGSNLLQAVRIAAARAAKRGAVSIRGDFLWPSEMTTAVVRVPTGYGAVRNVQYVPLEEIAEACVLCVKAAYAIQQEELITQIARLFGYNRTGERVGERIANGIKLAVDQKRLEIKDGAVRQV